jgi:phosphotriesterase-related protein
VKEKLGKKLMTTTGLIKAEHIGISLSHEHILVDFVGAAHIHPSRWDHQEVIRTIKPFLYEIHSLGCKTFFDCTPAYLGRDAALLKKLAQSTGLHIVTNTGYYGAVDNKYLPMHAFSETAEQLAARWTDEFLNGIDGTDVKPGFIKIGVNSGPLSELHKKLVRAAGLTHKATGLTIASHTGPAYAAFEQMELLRSLQVDVSNFIWVHAQEEKQDPGKRLEAARQGAWVSLDGVNTHNIGEYITMLGDLKADNLLHRVLVSHDAGWFDPGKSAGGEVRGYATIFRQLVPALQKAGFTQDDIDLLLVTNPSEAFAKIYDVTRVELEKKTPSNL